MRRVRDYVDSLSDPSSWREWLVRTRIPDGYWNATIGVITHKVVREFIDGALENLPLWLGEGKGIYIDGDFNTGKSSLAAIIAMDAARRAENVLWIDCRDVAGIRFRETPELAAVDDQLQRCDLLVLDDLGAERFRLGSAAGSALEDVVRIPAARGRSVIVTSNLSWRQAEARYQEIEAFWSILQRKLFPFSVVNDQWPDKVEKLF